MHASAQIIQHPNAAVSPVIQSRWYGQWPKGVVSMRVYQRKKRFASLAAAARAKEVQQHQEALDDIEFFVHKRRQWVNELAKSGTPVPW